jgi:hypothetical protein
VLRHAAIYADLPDEIDQAFMVLEEHVVRHGVLYPVALATVPILFDTLRRRSTVSGRIATAIARYASAIDSLDAPLAARMRQIMTDHSGELVRWFGRRDGSERALCAIVIAVPALRDVFLAAVEGAERVSPEVLLALVEIGEAPGHTLELAQAMFDGADATAEQRMCAATFLAKFAQATADLHARLDGALPPGADHVLRNYVDRLWNPTVVRPIVAPKMFDAVVTFTGKALVIVRAGGKSVTLPWNGAPIRNGDRIQVGMSTHGEPKLAVVTDRQGAVRVVDFDAAAPAVRFR